MWLHAGTTRCLRGRCSSGVCQVLLRQPARQLIPHAQLRACQAPRQRAPPTPLQQALQTPCQRPLPLTQPRPLTDCQAASGGLMGAQPLAPPPAGAGSCCWMRPRPLPRGRRTSRPRLPTLWCAAKPHMQGVVLPAFELPTNTATLCPGMRRWRAHTGSVITPKVVICRLSRLETLSPVIRAKQCGVGKRGRCAACAQGRV